VRIDSIVSPTELMKHADACGRGSMPTLNQTGELNAAYWRTRRNARSSLNAARSSAVSKYRCCAAQPAIVSTTRPTSCFTERSRSGEPMAPRKYFCATMLVAVWLQLFGTSMFFCSKTGLPRSSLMTAVRSSHSISSNGCVPSVAKKRLNWSPRVRRSARASCRAPSE
jgi:hypothetical protein